MRRRPLREPSAADRAAMLDTTRELAPRELAELQLELGYVDRALAIYEDLLKASPKDRHLRARCEWLLRLATAKARALRPPRAKREGGPRRRSVTLAGMPKAPTPARGAILPKKIVTVG